MSKYVHKLKLKPKVKKNMRQKIDCDKLLLAVQNTLKAMREVARKERIIDRTRRYPIGAGRYLNIILEMESKLKSSQDKRNVVEIAKEMMEKLGNFDEETTYGTGLTYGIGLSGAFSEALKGRVLKKGHYTEHGQSGSDHEFDIPYDANCERYDFNNEIRRILDDELELLEKEKEKEKDKEKEEEKERLARGGGGRRYCSGSWKIEA